VGEFRWSPLLIQATLHRKKRAGLLMLDEIAWDKGEVMDVAAGRRQNRAREMKEGERHR
jgi:hypothetical protein